MYLDERLKNGKQQQWWYFHKCLTCCVSFYAIWCTYFQQFSEFKEIYSSTHTYLNLNFQFNFHVLFFYLEKVKREISPSRVFTCHWSNWYQWTGGKTLIWKCFMLFRCYISLRKWDILHSEKDIFSLKRCTQIWFFFT